MRRAGSAPSPPSQLVNTIRRGATAATVSTTARAASSLEAIAVGE
jgi:hypothetical protein